MLKRSQAQKPGKKCKALEEPDAPSIPWPNSLLNCQSPKARLVGKQCWLQRWFFSGATSIYVHISQCMALETSIDVIVRRYLWLALPLQSLMFLTELSIGLACPPVTRSKTASEMIIPHIALKAGQESDTPEPDEKCSIRS